MWIQAEDGTLVNTNHLRKVQVEESQQIGCNFVARGYFTQDRDCCTIYNFKTREECDKFVKSLGSMMMDVKFDPHFMTNWFGKEITK